MTGSGRVSDPAAHFQTGGAAYAAFRPGYPPDLPAAALPGRSVSADGPDHCSRRCAASAPGAAILPMAARVPVRFPITLRAGRVA